MVIALGAGDINRIARARRRELDPGAGANRPMSRRRGSRVGERPEEAAASQMPAGRRAPRPAARCGRELVERRREGLRARARAWLLVVGAAAAAWGALPTTR